MNLLNVWFAKPLSKAEILERIRSDQTWVAQLASSCVRSIGNLELTLNPKQKACLGIRADSKFPMPAAHRFFEPVPPGWTTLASIDQTVKLWATRPLTPDMRIEQQAVNL